VWSRFPFFRVEDGADGYRVTGDDARYAPPSGESWAATTVVVPKLDGQARRQSAVGSRGLVASR
jgi:hypothetical protein